MIRLVILWGVLAGVAIGSETQTPQRFETTGVEMAVPIRLLFYAGDAETANRASAAVLAEFRRLNKIFSDYDSTSEARRLCNQARAGTAAPVSNDLFRVLFASRQLSLASDGAFDVTVGPLSKLWRRTLRRGEIPDPQTLADARSLVGYNLVELDTQHNTVKLLKTRMQLDFGGIAKGYALDAAMDVLRRNGIRQALVEASGDIRVGDPPPDKPGWRIGIARVDDDSPPGHYVTLSRSAVATSGDAWQYVEIDGRRYSHILDPRTGIALTDHGSVTIIAPTAMEADGLASAVSVLGPTEGMKLVESRSHTAALILRASKTGHEEFMSSRMRGILEPAGKSEPSEKCEQPQRL